jgi:hypothetical protein
MGLEICANDAMVILIKGPGKRKSFGHANSRHQYCPSMILTKALLPLALE